MALANREIEDIERRLAAKTAPACKKCGRPTLHRVEANVGAELFLCGECMGLYVERAIEQDLDWIVIVRTKTRSLDE